MKKIIRFKTNKAADKLQEANALGITDPKLVGRARDLARLAQKSRMAAIEADKKHNTALSSKLNKQADEIEDAIRSIYQDSIDEPDNVEAPTEAETGTGIQTGKNKGTNNSSDQEDPEVPELSDDPDLKGYKETQKQNNRPQEQDDQQDHPDQPDIDNKNPGNNKNSNKPGPSKGPEGKGKPIRIENPNGPGGDPPSKPGGPGEPPSGPKPPEPGEPGEPGEPPEGPKPNRPGNTPEGPEPGEPPEGPKPGKQKPEGQNKPGKQPNEPGDPLPFDPENPQNDDDPIRDPFADKQDIPNMPNFGKNQMKMPREATLDELIARLAQLKGKARDGAIDGIKDILKKKSNQVDESLTEAIKGIRAMDDDEYGDYVNSLIDLIQQADDVEEVTDIDDRINKINKMKTDPATARALRAEDNVELRKDYIARKAREAENAKYQNYPTIDQFELDFYETVKAQVADVKQTIQSYDEINNEYESENIIMKADVDREIPEESKPIIDFYFDCSGSWVDHPDAIEVGKRAVATVQEFADRGEVKLNIFYFGDEVSTNMYAKGVWNSGTGAWNKILQQIKKTEAKNVVLMTDCDMLGQAANGPTCVVDGCVWFIWSLYDYTRGSKQIVKHLKGMEGQAQFAFGSGGTRDPANYGDNL